MRDTSLGLMPASTRHCSASERSPVLRSLPPAMTGAASSFSKALLVLLVSLAPLLAQASVLVVGPSGHSCFRTPTNGLKCTGANGNGALGDGTTIPRAAPVDVVGLTSGVIAADVGSNHSCAVTAAGAVKCWGRGSEGQLGTGAVTDSLTPTTVSGLATGASAVALGNYYSCALTTTGGVKCWGDNLSGQLGDGTTTASLVPVDVSGLQSGVSNISAGQEHACATLDTGEVRCWGNNASGRLGDGTTTNSSVPVTVVGISSNGERVIVGGNHSCAIVSGNGLKCWGRNQFGQLGIGSNTDSLTAVDVTGLTSNVIGAAAGVRNVCALLTGGTVQCTGSNSVGQVGDGTLVDRNLMVPVIGLDSDVVEIGSRGFATCALLDDGRVQCWGENGAGKFGTGTINGRPTPTQVAGLTSGNTAIAVGDLHACALTAATGVKCWGLNSNRQLGDGTNTNRNAPVDVTGLTSGVLAITAGARHTCALVSGGSVQCWGRNAEGQVGAGDNVGPKPPTTVIANGALAVRASGLRTCALVTGGGVKCWGANTSGQVGNSTISASVNAPADVTGLTSGATDIQLGYSHSCAVTSAGPSGLLCWGSNSGGQVGDNSPGIDRSAPVPVSGLSSGVVKVDGGGQHTCALNGAGGVSCWGLNTSYQLLNGTYYTPASTPQPVPALTSGVSSIALGTFHSCFLLNTGGVRCGGGNYEGPLGTGNVSDELNGLATPVGLDSGVSAIGAGESLGCALTNGGAVKCWSRNLFGEAGDGSTLAVPVPVTSQFVYTPGNGNVLVQTPPLPPPPPNAVATGSKVAVGRDLVVASAPQAAVDGTDAGQVYVYSEAEVAPRGKLAFDAGQPGAKIGLLTKAVDDINLATLQMPISVNGDKFGQGGVLVNPSGTTIVVGAPGRASNRGSVFVFEKPPGGWVGTLSNPTEIVPPQGAAGDEFGAALAITNAGTVIVGAPGTSNDAGKAYVLRPNANGQLQISQTLDAGDNELAGARFGASITGEGAELAIGAPGQLVNDQVDAGAVVTFREPTQGSAYNLRQLITSINPALADKFGWSVDLDDGTLAVGAPGRDQPGAVDAGAVQVFDENSSGNLTSVATMVDPTPDPGAELGYSVQVQDQTIAAGAPYDDVNGNEDQGTVQVFVPGTSDSTLSGTLTPTVDLFNTEGTANDQYGTSFVYGEELAAAGAPNGDGKLNPKSARTKALAAETTGEALVYVKNQLFKDGNESPRGAIDGCASPAASIPDNDAVTGRQSEITLAGSDNVRDVDVEVRITHGYVSDLSITLTHVTNGKVVPLYVPTLPAQDCPGDDLELRFDDQAPEGFASATCGDVDPAVDGLRIPKDWLIQFQGMARAGPWRLTVKDRVAGNSGTLDYWCVNAR